MDYIQSCQIQKRVSSGKRYHNHPERFDGIRSIHQGISGYIKKTY